MRILIVTDAWSPQVNGVVRTLNAVIAELKAKGHDIRTINPEGRPSRPLPLYREITLTHTTIAAMREEMATMKALLAERDGPPPVQPVRVRKSGTKD